MMRRFLAYFGLVSLLFLAACSSFLGEPELTPIPTWQLPTFIAETFTAALSATAEQAALMTPSPQPSPALPGNTPAGLSPGSLTPTLSPAPPAIASPVATLTLTAPPVDTLIPSRTPGFTPTPSPLPDIPIAGIQIFRPGNSSRVTSPLRVSANLRPGAGGKVRVDLYGEDGRLLARQIKVFSISPSLRVSLSLDLEFQIVAVAETARLVISVEDEHGRLMALNSANLILLSVGESDMNPSDALLEAIVIEQPQAKTLVQGGTVLVRGLALPDEAGRLEAQLVDERGVVVGFRLIALGKPLPSGYAPFAVEVPYQVQVVTTVRLSVYRTGGSISPFTHLSSLEIFVSP